MLTKTYSSPFVKIEISSQKEAWYVITHLCDYCSKGAIGAFHCAGVDSMKCEKMKDKIKKDWLANGQQV